MASSEGRYVGHLGPYETVLAEWLALATRLGYPEIQPNGVEIGEDGKPKLVFIKPDGEPLVTDGKAFRKMVVGVEEIWKSRYQ